MKELITIIIPCRNEKLNLQKNYQMLKNLALLGHQVMIIDDQSNDESKPIYQMLSRFCEIHYIKKRLAKSVGKSNAIYYAIQYIKHEKILFLDADVVIEDLNILSTLVAQVDDKKVIGVIPMFESNNFSQAFAFYFYQLINMSAFLLKDQKALFGGFYLIKHSFYQEIGTHEKVINEVVEDVKIAHLVLENDGEIKIIKSPKIKVKMYDNISDISEGFIKNMKEGISLLSWNSVTIQVIYILAVAIFLTEFGKFSLIFYVLMTFIYWYTASFYLLIKKYYILLWPIFLFFFIYINFKSIFVKKRKWKGREYD